MRVFDINNHLPLIGILRGVETERVVEVATILNSVGFTMIEVPLNSPNALESIERLVSHFDLDEMMVGAGTVTSPVLAEQVLQTGANLIVTPNVNVEVIKRSKEGRCAVFPGVMTPTEAYTALDAGADGLKIFPVNVLGSKGFAAVMSILPNDALCFPVGGIEPTENSMSPFIKLGASGFGLGSALYKPSMSDDEIASNAYEYVSVYQRCIDKHKHA